MSNLLLGGPQFKVITDHKPLQYMFGKKGGEVPPRVERCIMDLQEYDYVVEYQPGKTMIADFMSRNHTKRKGSSQADEIERLMVNTIASQVVHAVNDAEGSAVSLNDVKEKTRNVLLHRK